MKFFIPITSHSGQAERLWNGMRAVLADRGLPTERRRIHSLFFRAEDAPRVLQVGVDDHETGEPVIFIYRAANAPFYWVVTPANGIFGGGPLPVAAEGTRVAEFDRDVEDPSRGKKKRRRPSRP
ncbi:MAG TPA: hypothetical protein VF702_10290 [Allosphingosinicella sp.]